MQPNLSRLAVWVVCLSALASLSACSGSESSNNSFSAGAPSLSPQFAQASTPQLAVSGGRSTGKETDRPLASPTPTRIVRIMPFGDSITSGNAYRKPLLELLKNNSISNVDFVGSLNDGSTPDGDHEGHACYKITSVMLAPGSGTFKRCTPNENSVGDFRDLDIWFSGSKPDIVLWHMGTNDAANREDASKVMRAFSATLSKLRQHNPKVTILVAQILPMTAGDVGPINTAIPQWASANSTTDSKIIVVDMNTGFDMALTYDGIHPNAAGGKWMADRWFTALKAILG